MNPFICSKTQIPAKPMVIGIWLLYLATTGYAANITMAVKDFPKLKVGSFAQYYTGTKCKSCIELDADKTGFSFGAAQGTFSGTDGIYDITLTTCGDGNGLCDYKMEVDGKSVGATFKQTQYKDEGIMPTTWKMISVKKGSVIQVMSNGSDSHHDAPGKGPNGFHMAHGRWTKVEFALKSTSIFRYNNKSVLKRNTKLLTTLGLDAQGRLITLKSSAF